MENQSPSPIRNAFDYSGTPITFIIKNGMVFINATEMAKSFGKKTNDYMNNKKTLEFIVWWMEENPVAGNPVTAIQGGNNQGTWMHEDIALDFASWLSPKFKLWCINKIKELLKKGRVELETKTEAEKVLEVINILQSKIAQQAPKVEYVEKVLLTEDTFTTTQIAKELGMSATKLHKRLQELKVMFRQSGEWFLYSKYQDKGFTKTRTTIFADNTGKEHSNVITVWTQKGRAYLHKLFNQELSYNPNM